MFLGHIIKVFAITLGCICVISLIGWVFADIWILNPFNARMGLVVSPFFYKMGIIAEKDEL